MSKDLNELRQELHLQSGKLNYLLERFGDDLAKKEGYKDLDGMEAIWLYLIKTHHWTPAQVKAMHADDIRFILTTEMQGWVVKD